MKVNKRTDLVPVKALVRTEHKPGTVYGLRPDLARKQVEAGAVELYPIPADEETYEVPGPRRRGQVEGAEEEPVADLAPVIDIPPDWNAAPKEGGLQWMQKVKLAERILGAALEVAPGKKPQEVAIAVIAEELKRRAAAETEPQT